MRPKTFLISMQDPDRALDDPGLRALTAAGWTCAASWPVVRTDNSGGHESVQMMLLLWPPTRSTSELVVPAPVPWSGWERAVVRAGTLFTGGAVGAVLYGLAVRWLS